MTVNLLDMPVEVLQGIVRSLCPHCEGNRGETERLQVTYPNTENDQRWRSAIANYSSMGGLYQTSRSLRAVVTPVLLHRVVVQSWPRDELFPLTQFFFRHQDFALEVKEVSIIEISGETRRTDFSDADFDFVKSAYSRWGHSIPQLRSLDMLHHNFASLSLWTGDLAEEKNTGIRPFLIDLLLSCVTSIELLSVECVDCQPLGRHVPPSIRLPFLEDLDIKRDEDEEGIVELWDHSQLLRMAPNLSCLQIALCVSVPAKVPLENVRSLHLDNGKLGYHDINSLVKSCPKLESFRYSCGGFSGEEYDDHQRFSGRELCWALRSLKATLKNLDVDLSRNERFAPGDMMDNLTENTSLEHIRLGSNCLFPEDTLVDQPVPPTLVSNLLPATIRSIRLGRINDELYPAVAHFADTVLAGTFRIFSLSAIMVESLSNAACNWTKYFEKQV